MESEAAAESSPFCPRQLKEIPPQFYELTSLTDLGVMCNLLTTIPITLCKKLTALTTLNMYNNNLTAIPDGISALKNLKSLNLERNKIEKISGRISFLNQLEYLRLTANRIKTLPEKFHRLKNIKELHLDVNNLHKLPDAIVELPKLRILLLMKNTSMARTPCHHVGPYIPYYRNEGFPIQVCVVPAKGDGAWILQESSLGVLVAAVVTLGGRRLFLLEGRGLFD